MAYARAATQYTCLGHRVVIAEWPTRLLLTILQDYQHDHNQDYITEQSVSDLFERTELYIR
jgi:hypothetical protein